PARRGAGAPGPRALAVADAVRRLAARHGLPDASGALALLLLGRFGPARSLAQRLPQRNDPGRRAQRPRLGGEIGVGIDERLRVASVHRRARDRAHLDVRPPGVAAELREVMRE